MSVEDVALLVPASEHRLKVMQPNNSLLKQAMDDRTYPLDNTSGKYTKEIGKTITGMSKLMDIHLKPKHFDPSYTIIFLAFLFNL